MSLRTLPGAESADRYQESLSTLLRQLPSTWLVREYADGLVRSYAVQPRATQLPHQGWKLHLSAAPSEATSLCDCVVPFLIDAQASFKIMRDSESFFTINSGHAGATQVGKILTVYESPDYDLGTLARRLSLLWTKTKGPQVPSDLQMTGAEAVFFRYGVIAA